MKYSKIDAIQDVLTIKIENNLLCMQDKNYVLKMQSIKADSNIYDCFYIKNKWFFNGLDNCLYTFEDDNSFVKVLENKPISELDRVNGKLLLSFETHGNAYKRALFDVENLQEMSFDYPIVEMWQTILNDTIVFYSHSKIDISVLNLINKQILWHFSLSTLTDLYPDLQASWEVWHFVGVVEGVLWVCVDNITTNRGALLGLDTQTGKVLHFIHAVEAQTPKCLFTELPSQGNTQYDALTHKMIGFYAHYYWEIDLHSSPYKAKIWNLEDELKLHYTEFPRVRGSAMNETHIFAFSGKLNDFCKNKVFAFNRQTFQIDWDYEFEYVPMKTEITETHLFVLDGNGMLHIFEKE